MSHRGKPDVWIGFHKKNYREKRHKTDKKTRKKLYDESGDAIYHFVDVRKAKCKKCTEEMCTNGCTMANHYHDCVKPNVFDKNGYFLHQTNQRKRSFSQTATSQTSHSPNAKKQKLNEDDEEYVDLSYSNITPNQYKKYEQLLLTDKQWQLVNKDNMKRKKHKSTLKKAKAVQSRCIKSKFGGFVKENKVKYDIIQKIEIIHNITDTSDPQFNTLYKDYDKYNKRNGFTKTPQTREWGSTFKLYENQIKYKKHIKRTLDSDQIEKTKQYLKPTLKNKTNIKKIIEDEQHWNDMQEYLDKYELIRERLIKSQGDVNVSDIEYHFHRVQEWYKWNNRNKNNNDNDNENKSESENES
eukprot:136765_1